MSDKDIKNWDQRLDDQQKRNWDNYVRRRIDLTTARVDDEFYIAGEFIYIEKTSSGSATGTIKLNRNTNDSFDLVVGSKLETIFIKFYITNDAQPGKWIDIIIGINFKYEKPFSLIQGQAQQVLNLTHPIANTDVAAAANVCNRALIKASPNNTDLAWIDFGVAAVQNNCMPLDAGEWIEVAISNTAMIHANFVVGGELCFIEYEA